MSTLSTREKIRRGHYISKVIVPAGPFFSVVLKEKNKLYNEKLKEKAVDEAKLLESFAEDSCKELGIDYNTPLGKILFNYAYFEGRDEGLSVVYSYLEDMAEIWKMAKETFDKDE